MNNIIRACEPSKKHSHLTAAHPWNMYTQQLIYKELGSAYILHGLSDWRITYYYLSKVTRISATLASKMDTASIVLRDTVRDPNQAYNSTTDTLARDKTLSHWVTYYCMKMGHIIQYYVITWRVCGALVQLVRLLSTQTQVNVLKPHHPY